MENINDNEFIKNITNSYLFHERTQEDIDSEKEMTQALFDALGIYHITCQYGKSSLFNCDLVETCSYHYNKDKTVWKKSGIYTSNFCNSEKEDILKRLEQINSEEQYQKELDYMQRHEIQQWNTKKEVMQSLTEKYFVDSLNKIERELWGLNNKENMSADKEPNLTEGHSEIELEKQRIWERHNKYEGAVKGYKKERNKQTHLTPPKKKRK